MENNYTEKELESICNYINKKEINAAKAERDSIKFKQAEFLMDKIGEEYEAVITGIKDWGVYCEILENQCEGVISKESLESKGFRIISEKYKIVGNAKFQLGDSINIKIKKVSLLKKEIEYEII